MKQLAIATALCMCCAALGDGLVPRIGHPNAKKAIAGAYAPIYFIDGEEVLGDVVWVDQQNAPPGGGGGGGGIAGPTCGVPADVSLYDICGEALVFDSFEANPTGYPDGDAEGCAGGGRYTFGLGAGPLARWTNGFTLCSTADTSTNMHGADIMWHWGPTKRRCFISIVTYNAFAAGCVPGPNAGGGATAGGLAGHVWLIYSDTVTYELDPGDYYNHLDPGCGVAVGYPPPIDGDGAVDLRMETNSLDANCDGTVDGNPAFFANRRWATGADDMFWMWGTSATRPGTDSDPDCWIDGYDFPASPYAVSNLPRTAPCVGAPFNSNLGGTYQAGECADLTNADPCPQPLGPAFAFRGPVIATCEPCDANCDGSINGFDIDPFVAILSAGGGGCAPGCSGDANSDGSVNGFDIDPFVCCIDPDCP